MTARALCPFSPFGMMGSEGGKSGGISPVIYRICVAVRAESYYKFVEPSNDQIVRPLDLMFQRVRVGRVSEEVVKQVQEAIFSGDLRKSCCRRPTWQNVP